MGIAARCIKHRSALRFLKQNTAPLVWRVVAGTPEGGGAVLQLTRVALLWHLKKTN